MVLAGSYRMKGARRERREHCFFCAPFAPFVRSSLRMRRSKLAFAFTRKKTVNIYGGS